MTSDSRSNDLTRTAPDQVDAIDLASMDDKALARHTLPAAHDKLKAPDLATWVMHVQYQRCRDRTTRNQLAERYADYAARLARSMYRHGAEPLEELTQVAFEALLLAIERFDTSRRLPFEAFARPTIVGHLKRHYRDQGWCIRVPRRVQEIAVPIRQTVDELTQRLGRIPDAHEVAEAMDLDETVVDEVLIATHRRAAVAMDAPVAERGGDDRWTHLGILDQTLVGIDDHIALSDALKVLGPDERVLLDLYFNEGLSQAQIGTRLGVSQMQVSRKINRIVKKLRRQIAA